MHHQVQIPIAVDVPEARDAATIALYPGSCTFKSKALFFHVNCIEDSRREYGDGDEPLGAGAEAVGISVRLDYLQLMNKAAERPSRDWRAYGLLCDRVAENVRIRLGNLGCLLMQILDFSLDYDALSRRFVSPRG